MQKKSYTSSIYTIVVLLFIQLLSNQALHGQCSVSVGPANNYGCEGGSVTLTATLTNPPASPTYSWTGPNGFTATTAAITLNNLDNSDAGTYTVTIGGGCTGGTNTASVNLGILSNFTVTQNDIVLCPGQNNISFSPTISGNNSITPTYSWTGPGTYTSTNASPSITNATSVNSGNYGVTATIGQCTATDNASVLVLNALDVSATANGPLCEGQALNLTSSVTGNSGQSVSYSWTGPNNFTSSQANPNINNVGAAQNGTYTVTVTSNGCSDNGSVNTLILVPSINSGQFSSLSNYNGWLVRCTLHGQTSGPISI
jgi:hypothetical protein